MKVKHSVIPFALAAVIMLGVRIMSIFGLDNNGNFLGMNKMGLSYLVVGIGLALFVVCIVINIIDRKTAPIYPVKKNFAAILFAALSGVAVIAYSIYTLLNTTVNSEYYVMTLVAAIFSIPAGIALMLMTSVHISGKAIESGVSMLFVFPSLWGCTQLVAEFLSATKVSISSSDLTSLFCYIFLTLYYFSHAMVVSKIKGRNPVKACFIYGLPAIALSVSNGAYILLTASREGMPINSLLRGSLFIILSLYALSFILEMSTNLYTKDEAEVIDGLPGKDSMSEEEKYLRTGGYDDLVFSDRKEETNTKDEPADDYYSNAKGLDDFIIGYQNEEHEDEPIPYLTKHEMEKAVDSGVVIPTYSIEDDLRQPGTIETPENEAAVTPITNVGSGKSHVEQKPEQKQTQTVAKQTKPAPARKPQKPAQRPAQKQQRPVQKSVSGTPGYTRKPVQQPVKKASSTPLEDELKKLNRSAQQTAQPSKVPEVPKTKRPEPELSDIDKLIAELDNIK